MKIQRFLLISTLSIFSCLIFADTASAQTDAKRKNFGEIMKKFDKNKDGALSKDEVPTKIWEKLSQADRNGDGTVSKGEFTKATQMMQQNNSGGRRQNGPRGAASVIKTLDKNKDGKLTKSEVSTEMWAKISKLDTSGDGSVNRAELNKAYAKPL